MSNEAPPNVCLRTIANWQLAPDSQTKLCVSLPKIQRGFVWDPGKVINLWDSLLRGFPIGSLMLSEVAEEGALPPETNTQTYWLLDGQQRATSIAMGYYNPWSKTETGQRMWSLKDCSTVWLDLLPEVKDETKLYYPLLVTKSHPWGYAHNGEVLKWCIRGDALSAYKSAGLDDKYTSYPAAKCFPHQPDGFPVPMALLIEANQPADSNSNENFQKKLTSLCNDLPEAWKTLHMGKIASVGTEYWMRLRKAVSQLHSRQVHLNYLSQEAAANDRFTNEDNSVLFVRLNAGGTPLEGEELIFSMFKSSFPKAKDAIENAATDFMAPSKLFSLFIRLVLSEREHHLLWKPVSLRDFKRYINNDKEQKFKEPLEELIVGTVAGLMEKARDLLAQPQSDFCLPGPVLTRTINQSPDVFLALLYWLWKGGTVELGGEDHRKLIGYFTAIAWFGPGNARDKRDALQSWSEFVGRDVVTKLWTPGSIQRLFTREEGFLPYFPTPNDLSGFLIGTVINMDDYHYDRISGRLLEHAFSERYRDFFARSTPAKSTDQIPAHFRTFIDKLRPCRHMLLFAQRHFIRDAFGEFGQWEYSLKDSNCPWDWDHIYPSAYGLHKVNRKYKDWHSSIGNLRAEKLSENRSNQEEAPTKKLTNPNSRENSFISEDIWTLMQNVGMPNIKDDENSVRLCGIVLKRMIEIYREWYDVLRIGSLTESSCRTATTS